MTPVAPTEHRPRHGWGWMFVALFFLELIVFGAIASNLNSKIEQLRGYLASPSVAWSTQIEIDKWTKQRNQLYLLSAVLLSGTLVCAAIGLRRRKDTAR